MKAIHTPPINGRYWTAILLASVFGTNLGDFYAHTAHLGIVKGLMVLALLAAAVFITEHLVDAGSELYYWLVIIIIRTGATNIADYLMYRLRVPGAALITGLAALIALFGWATRAKRTAAPTLEGLSSTGTAYWLAMLAAGVFGTVAGDFSEHGMGDGVAALVLTALFFAVLFFTYRHAAKWVAVYWTTVAVARTAGTAIGDWLAESKALQIGLPLCTLLSGIAFAAVLVFWRTNKRLLSSI